MNIDNGNKNEFMLWVAILGIIAVFIFFMPDIEKFLFRRAEKKDIDTEEIREAKRKETNRVNNEAKKEETETKKKVKAGTSTTGKASQGNTYTCTLDKKESFYTQKETTKYVFDTNGKTLTMDSDITVKVDNVDSYNQMKTMYQAIETMFDKLDKDFNKFYTTTFNADDSTKTIKITAKLTNYTAAMEHINKYNKEHENEKIGLDVYGTYNDTEINMKSNGYNCKIS